MCSLQGSDKSDPSGRSSHAIVPTFWGDRIAKFVKYAAIENRTYRLKKYRSAFVGSEMVDSLVYHKVVKSRREAVVVGRVLERDYKLFIHAGGPGPRGNGLTASGLHGFCDDALWYRFNLDAVKKYVKNYDETIASWGTLGAEDDEEALFVSSRASSDGSYFDDAEAIVNAMQEKMNVATIDGSIHHSDLPPRPSPRSVQAPSDVVAANNDSALWSSFSSFQKTSSVLANNPKQAQEFRW
ncbi:MAG: hypothetical protein SGARI_001934 [Bacillariaceae sp.]